MPATRILHSKFSLVSGLVVRKTFRQKSQTSAGLAEAISNRQRMYILARYIHGFMGTQTNSERIVLNIDVNGNNVNHRM